MTEDMMLLLDQSVPHLQKDENILLINSLCVHDDLARASDKLSKGHKGKILVYSASGRMLREKLDFLSKLIVAKQVKLLVLNSWEFAACGSRQKHALAHWLREMRDGNKVRIVVYSREPKCPEFGALPLLGYTANSTDEMGEWRWHDKYTKDQFFPNATETVLEYMEAREAERSDAAASDVADQSGTSVSRKKRGVLEFIPVGDILKAQALKNKELEGVGAQGTYAVAA